MRTIGLGSGCKTQDEVLVLSENEKITKIDKLYKVGIRRNESKL